MDGKFINISMRLSLITVHAVELRFALQDVIILIVQKGAASFLSFGYLLFQNYASIILSRPNIIITSNYCMIVCCTLFLII